MLRIHCSKGNAQACARYFDQHLSVGDYYFEDLENKPDQWHGKGAERLGLSGSIKREHFCALLNNLHPHTGQKLTPRMKKNRRPGYDFGFSVPKGVSIAYLIGEDHRIKTAFLNAVRFTMHRMEREAKSRFRDKGADYDIITGNLVWSEHVHDTARPVRGFVDPHLHAHCFVQNMTWREDKKRFMAVQVGDLKRDATRFQEMYFKQLKANLKALGYEIERTAKGWDIAGITPEVKAKFSRRTAQIERTAKELNITDPKQKAQLGATTREHKKTQKLSYKRQKAEWKLRATLAGFRTKKHLTEHQRSLRQSFKKYEEKQACRQGTTLFTTKPFTQKRKAANKPEMSKKTWEEYRQFERELRQKSVPKTPTIDPRLWRDFQR